MKIARRVAKFSPWAVAAVMALEIAQPALAQSPRPINSARMTALPMVSDDASINVQIAWLGDPALFCCNLIAKDTPEGVELIGYVPNEAVRQKALHIAKTICGDKIVNHLRLQVGMTIPLTRPAAPAELAPQASTILAEALGDKVMGLRIISPTAGKVEIAGSVPTAEDKLLISRSLKKLNGCIYVVNRVNATGSNESAALVDNVPLMSTMPAPMPQSEPARPFVMTMPEATQKPLKPINMPLVPAVVRSEPVQVMSLPTEVVTKPKVVPVVVAKTEPVAVVKNEVPVETDSRPARMATIKDDVPAPIQKLEPIIEPDAPKLGSASVSDMPGDMMPKAAAPIIVPPPIIVEPTPVVKRDQPKMVVVAPPMVVKSDPPKSSPSSAFNPLRIKTESKPIEVVKNTAPVEPKLPEIMPEAPKPVTAVELPKVMELQPAPPKSTVEVVAPKKFDLVPEAPKPVVVESPKTLDLMPDAPKPMIQPKTTVLIPEMPKPNTHVAPAPKMEPAHPLNAGSASVSDMGSHDVVSASPKTELPVVAPAPKVEPMVQPKMGTASVCDTPVPEMPKETMKPVMPVVAPAPKVEPMVQPKMGTASVCDTPIKEVPQETMKPVMPVVAPAPKVEPMVQPKMGTAGVCDTPVPEMPKETMKPVTPVVAPAESKPIKVDRFVPPAPPMLPARTMPYEATPPAPLPTLKSTEPAMESTSINDNKIQGVIRQPGAAGAALDSNTVRKAIEDICRGSAENISVRETAGHQLTVGMNVTSQGEWDRLYAKVKNLPEVAGYSVIYNVSVEPAAKSAANLEPMRGIIRTSATSPMVEGDAVKKAIENLCRGRGSDIAIRTTGKQQVTVAMKVRSATDWELLYRKIKELPEIAGYAVIYNVSVK